MRQPETHPVSHVANGHPPADAEALSHLLAPDTLNGLSCSLKKQGKCYRKQLRKCQRKFSERSIHDVRVSARRLLSLLDLLGPFLSPDRLKKTQSALKRHLDAFDDLRDTQVQLASVRDLREQFSAARRFYRSLKKREERLTRSTHKETRRLHSKSLGKLIEAARKDVKAWMATAGVRPPSPLLLSAVNRAFFLTKELKEHIRPADTHSIHCTRVAFKRFRYVMEALADHMPWADERLLAGMHRYQSLMGDIQDAQVLLRAFQKFLRKETTDLQKGARFEHELQRRREVFVKRYLCVVDQVLDFWPPARCAVRRKQPPALGNGRHARRSISGVTHLQPSTSKTKDL